MKKNIVPLAFVALVTMAACGPNQSFTKIVAPDAAPVLTATASTTATAPDAAVAPTPDAAPVNTVTASATATATATPTATPTAIATNTVTNTVTSSPVDAGSITYIIQINLGPTDTGTGTGTGTGSGTGTGTGSNADAGTVTPDAANNDVPQACIPVSNTEICGNGIDDNCNGTIDEGCDVVRADALPATPDAQPQVRIDASPAPDTAPVLVADAQVLADTKPADVQPAVACAENEISVIRNCAITLPNGVVKWGYLSCVAGQWTGCKDMDPPQNAMSCIGHLKNEVYYASCKAFDGCFDGLYVCNGNTWEWECQLDTSWYISPNCIKNDAGSPDTLGTVDTHVSVDTTPVVTPDAGTADSLVTPTDAQAPTDAIVAGCQVSVNGQITTLVNGQSIDCTANDASGEQQCVSGMLSTCVIGASATTMGDHAIIDCQLSGTNVGTLTLTGNVIGDLYDSGVINKVCLIGDSVGGWAGNHTDCLDYNPFTSFRYIFTNVSLPSADNRITFLGYLKTVNDGGVAEGPERWDNNFVLLYAATAGNKCRMKDYGYNKVVFSQ